MRRYLESIRVPLFVWSLYGKRRRAAAKAWGTGRGRLQPRPDGGGDGPPEGELDAQRIVWLDGRHLPQAVALGAAAKGVELVGK